MSVPIKKKVWIIIGYSYKITYKKKIKELKIIVFKYTKIFSRKYFKLMNN